MIDFFCVQSAASSFDGTTTLKLQFKFIYLD